MLVHQVRRTHFLDTTVVKIRWNPPFLFVIILTHSGSQNRFLLASDMTRPDGVFGGCRTQDTFIDLFVPLWAFDNPLGTPPRI